MAVAALKILFNLIYDGTRLIVFSLLLFLLFFFSLYKFAIRHQSGSNINHRKINNSVETTTETNSVFQFNKVSIIHTVIHIDLALTLILNMLSQLNQLPDYDGLIAVICVGVLINFLHSKNKNANEINL